jgi:hypothetical protein
MPFFGTTFQLSRILMEQFMNTGTTQVSLFPALTESQDQLQVATLTV